ncbi:Protein of unknown function [Pyronema omphalodes CBS 100304]|uniref:Uncharacterized protein n=1 Tax=Pyronema omphalodes (strain CBS 100304) TaxID=1076935 RepID=U4LFB0_PYROM|nr:Protein of unknown function [Pyronema omphalodes CBS 100304]
MGLLLDATSKYSTISRPACKCTLRVPKTIACLFPVEGSTLTPGVSSTGEFVSPLDFCTDLFADSVYINHSFIFQ